MFYFSHMRGQRNTQQEEGKSEAETHSITRLIKKFHSGPFTQLIRLQRVLCGLILEGNILATELYECNEELVTPSHPERI